MAKQTVANLLQVPIHYYVLVDWRAFIDVIDLIGGVDLYVEKDMYYEDPYADLVIDIKHGYQHLDGKRAGEYVRFRKDELGDIGRVQRQQKFMKAAAAQIFNIDTVTKIPALFSTVDRHVETDMNTLTMIKAANSLSCLVTKRSSRVCCMVILTIQKVSAIGLHHARKFKNLWTKSAFPI